MHAKIARPNPCGREDAIFSVGFARLRILTNGDKQTMRNYYLVARRHLGVLRNFWKNRAEHARQNGPDMPSQLWRMAEQYRLQALNGIQVNDYYELGLDATDMPWKKKREYVGQSDLPRLYSAFNDMKYRMLATDKALFHALAHALGINAVPVLALYGTEGVDTLWPVLHTRDDLHAFLVTEERENLFFKPDHGTYGMGALSLGERAGPAAWVDLPSGRVITFDEVVAHLQANARPSAVSCWIVQNRITAHPDLSKVIAGVTPTLRVMTLNRGKGEVEVTGAVMRFGDGDAPADNSGTGGVVFLVDTATGILGKGVYSVRHRPVFIHAHPRTGVEVSGMSLPFWREAVELCIASARKLPQFANLGWDVVIGDDGPAILEVNAHSGVLSLQKLNGKGLLAGPLRPYLQAASGIERSGITVPKTRH